MESTLVLTDDELVSIAADADAPIPVALPTVDVDDEYAVAAAVVRGQRSLFVRELIGEEDDSRIAQLQLGLSGRARLSCYVGDRTLSRFVPVPATTWLPVGDGFLRIHEGPVGTHVVVHDSADSALREIQGVLRTALESSAQPGADERVELWICVAAVTTDVVDGLAVRHGEVLATSLAPDGGDTSTSVRAQDVDDVVERLVSVVAAGGGARS